MKRRIRCIALLVCLLLPFVLSSCSSVSTSKPYTAQSFDYFDTVTTITGYAESKEEFDAVAADIFAQLSKYHKLYSIYESFDGMENLCTVNQSDTALSVDERIIDLMLYAKKMYDETDGMLNVAMGGVLSLWHECRTRALENPDQASLPSKEELDFASQHTNINDLLIDEDQATIERCDPLMKIDVGAVAKGYAIEQIAQELEQKGINGYLINVGGNIRTLGVKPNGNAWSVGIENPKEGESYLATLQLLGNVSVATSGSYQRYFTFEGQRYCHIIDPQTQMPANGFLSVSVISSDSALSDSLSTALFCMSYETGRALVERMPKVEAIWVKENGESVHSSGFDGYVKQ